MPEEPRDLPPSRGLSRERLSAAFEEHRRTVWGLCYRLTGTAADADELTQETFARVLERPPPDLAAPLRPWLLSVAVNLAKDALRRRRRTPYVGPWLPSPIETPEAATLDEDGSERRYGLMESVSFAFLLALEALSPLQRAVLILADVLDYSSRESAAALAISEANVRTTHHRALKAMARYDAARCVPTRALQERNRQALEAFLGALLSNDVARIEALLARDVRALNDGAGEFSAARIPLLGREKVAKFLRAITAIHAGVPLVLAELRLVNGLPALVSEWESAPKGQATRVVTRVDVDAEGEIVALHSVLATAKLTQISWWKG